MLRLVAALLLLAHGVLKAEVRRVVIFKLDGVNADLLQGWLEGTDPRTGRSQLPWLNEIFVRGGARMNNFYVRGLSLSAPSWSLLDSGRHQVIRGNVEYDRWTLHAYDYLNFFPFYVNYSQKKQVDMPATEVMDECGIPLLLDSFKPAERWQSFQLYQRGNDWTILKGSLPHHYQARSIRDWFDEWETGPELASTIGEEQERQIEAATQNARIAYIDFFSGDWDHVAHLTNDPANQLRAMQALDAAIGRMWSAANASSMGSHTLFVVVSDHGMNTSPSVMSQGYSLVNWFNSISGGAQHVITDRHPLADYKLRGLDPFVHKVVTPSLDSTYLKKDPRHYPTVLLDVDGNERAAIQLRSNAWNMAQVLLATANDPRSSAAVKAACRRELSRWAEQERARWAPEAAEMERGIAAIERVASAAENVQEESWDLLEARRRTVRAAAQRQQVHEYREYVASVREFLAMPSKADASLVPKESLGPDNSIYDLQNYVTGPAEGGIVLDEAGRVDLDRSFSRIDYVSQLQSIKVRNVVQPGISNRPVDFAAISINAMALTLKEPHDGAVWLWGGADHQAIVLYRQAGERFEIRYLPVKNVLGRRDGSISFEPCEWSNDLPLRILEDPQLRISGGTDRLDWLSKWHSDREWLDATYATRYSNGIVGLTELFRKPEIALPAWATRLSAADRESLLAWTQRRRALVAPDIEVFASDHWNFNVRNFNSGGNHGAFFHESTHSVLMFAGGGETGIPRGLVIDRPYDSLSLVPTVLELMNRKGAGPDLAGAPITEVLARR